MPELRVPDDKVLVLDDDARLDEAALLAFLGGHCHSLALALHERTEWPLVAIYERTDGACVHVAVRRPDGTIVDIAGAHTPEQINNTWAEGVIIREASVEELQQLHEKHGWSEPVPTVVMPWAQIALKQAEGEPRPPMTTASFTCGRTTVGGTDVRVLWDGEPYLTVEVRMADTTRSWQRYGRFAFQRDGDGLYRYSFTLEWFVPLAEAWLEREFDERRARRILAA